MKQIPLGLRDDAAPSFDTFLAGANAAALSYLEGLAADIGGRAPADPVAPVYLWGPAGSGKTHLLRALASSFEHQGARVGWFSANDAAPWPDDDRWSLIVMDDCGRFDAAQQQSAFRLFVEAAAIGAMVAAAGALPPTDLPLRDDLRSRLGWGEVFALQSLDDSGVRAALQLEAARRGAPMSEEVVGYLLTRFTRDLKSLMELLDRFDYFALSAHRGLTVPLLKQMLAEESS